MGIIKKLFKGHDRFTVDDDTTPVDTRILPYISKFVGIGLLPVYSCEGHVKDCLFHPYFMFSFRRSRKNAINFVEEVSPIINYPLSIKHSRVEGYHRVVIEFMEKERSNTSSTATREIIKNQFFTVLDGILTMEFRHLNF